MQSRCKVSKSTKLCKRDAERFKMTKDRFRLTRDLKFLTRASGSDLLFLPFANAGKCIQFSEYAKDNLGADESTVAIHWNRNIVDGEKLMPKLPVHIRTHRELFDRNQRIRGMQEKTEAVRKQLSRINQITYRLSKLTNNPTVEGFSRPSEQDSDVIGVTTAATSSGFFGTIPMPPAFALPALMALHNAPYSTIFTSTIGEPLKLPTRRRKVRKDKGVKRKEGLRKPSRCMTCVNNGGSNFYTCNGRASRGICQYFDTNR